MARIIIDGYNLMPVTDFSNREELLKALSIYQKTKGHDVTIVFDGTHQGTGSGDHYHTGGIEVIFSPLTVTADETIESMLSPSRASGTIVVTSDRSIQSAARRVGATFVYSNEFARKLKKASVSFSRSKVQPWEEGRNDFGSTRRSSKKGSAKKRSKEDRRRQKKLDIL